MSNTNVGTTYEQIINDVIESSKGDFEENGVEESVLDELMRGWKKKLSQMGVAQFPWDPQPTKPDPVPASQPPTVPSNTGHYSGTTLAQATHAHAQATHTQAPHTQAPPAPAPVITAPQLPQMNNSPQMNNGGMRIKQEPGMEHNMTVQPVYVGITPAEARAAQQLQSTFGPRAQASINAIQQSGGAQQGHPQQYQHQQGHPQQGQPQQHPSQQGQQQKYQPQQGHYQQSHSMQGHPQQGHPQQGQPQQGLPQRPVQGNVQAPQRPTMPAGQGSNQSAQSAYRQAMAMQAAQQRQAAQNPNGQNGQQNGVNRAQHDGAGDDETESVGILKQVGPNGETTEMGRIEIDNLLRRQIEARGKAMEGGGLMMPLAERRKAEKKLKKRKAGTSGAVAAEMQALVAAQTPQPSKNAGPIAQYDGLNDDDEDDKNNILKEEGDEDAINSDLDDSDDQLGDDDDDDDPLAPMMLCMYDKVQRVKNKWKCVMKDGVLTVNGKEYVFHKASGEYEW